MRSTPCEPLRLRPRARRTGSTPAARDEAQAADSGSVESLAGQAELKVAWDGTVPEPFRLREEAVLRADLAQLSDALKALDRQMAEKLATQKRLDMSIAFQNTLMETLNQRVSTRQQAIDLNVGTKIDLYNAKEELEKSQAALASDQGQLIETDAALRAVRSEKAKTVSQFIADNENKLAEAARKADEARQALAKADARLARTRLYAPTDGVVQQMAVTTVGQVVTTGQQLIVLTPIGGKLQVEALVANLDIGFVKPGQDAVIKVDAFPFTRFGALHGKVVNIASAAIAEQDAKRALANATATANVAARGADRPRSTRELRLSGDRGARRNRDENRQCDNPLDPRHDRHRRNQDRLPPRHRLPALAPGQNRFRSASGRGRGPGAMSLGLRELGSASARHRSESARGRSDRRASAVPLCGCCAGRRERSRSSSGGGGCAHGLFVSKLAGVEGHPEEASMNELTTVGLDLAKNVFPATQREFVWSGSFLKETETCAGSSFCRSASMFGGDGSLRQLALLGARHRRTGARRAPDPISLCEAVC